ncbi:MAG: SIMPL domain-containing protein [Candidatus Binataceae bacterium]
MLARVIAALIVAAWLAASPAIAAPARAADKEPKDAQVRTVEVSGNGEAHATPDLAFLNLAIETRAPTAEQTASRNAALAQKIVSALKARLGEKGKIWTGGYSLNPEYAEPGPGRKPTVTAYVAQNSITVQTGETNLLGALIDAAIAAGANRVNYLNFTLSNDTKPRTEAIAKAANDAAAQAQALAQALGVRLKRIVRASTVSEVRPIPMAYARTEMMAAQAPTPVEPGEVTVPATVSLVYEIE